jgi:hypothetical protein
MSIYCTPAYPLSCIRTYCHALSALHMLSCLQALTILYFLRLSSCTRTCLFPYTPALSTYVHIALLSCYYLQYMLVSYQSFTYFLLSILLTCYLPYSRSIRAYCHTIFHFRRYPYLPLLFPILYFSCYLCLAHSLSYMSFLWYCGLPSFVSTALLSCYYVILYS